MWTLDLICPCAVVLRAPLKCLCAWSLQKYEFVTPPEPGLQQIIDVAVDALCLLSLGAPRLLLPAQSSLSVVSSSSAYFMDQLPDNS